MDTIKFFNKWDSKGIEVEDPGLKNVITLQARLVPKTGARYAKNRFHRSKISIVERLINKLQVSGHKGKKHFISSGRNTGKTNKIMNMVKECFELIESRTNQNPIAVFVKAVENAAPRDEVVPIEYGGARYSKALECAPQRRVDLVLRYFTQGAYQKAFNKKIDFVEALADEIINSYELSTKSTAISKKLETERQADSSR
jgi:small subunit ribosomal protein S7